MKKKTSSKKKPTKKARRKRTKKLTLQPYQAPKTAAELGINCLVEITEGVVCGAPAEWFDYELGNKDFYPGFVCDAHKVSTRVEKLAMPTSIEAAERSRIEAIRENTV